eukprot:CAMPEP_0182579972 /NCGR_PEP_ID=MMETSP1324-20130603/45643_1 /TAXON_ID=236786 /ORGANISM="Florenciella sp., Strain RCC1587" /LENGTH=44 /DNA_ID= /DNA_START= /DNA_END= /DNA_ORIENTATION=
MVAARWWYASSWGRHSLALAILVVVPSVDSTSTSAPGFDRECSR